MDPDDDRYADVGELWDKSEWEGPRVPYGSYLVASHLQGLLPPNASFGDKQRLIAQMWREMNAEQRQRFIDLHQAELERYQQALQDRE